MKEIKSQIIKIRTNREFDIVDITDSVRDVFKNNFIKEGFALIFSKHTTLAIKINEYEPLLLKDYANFVKKVYTNAGDYYHDMINLRKDVTPDEPKNALGHLMCLLLESSQIIPVINNTLQLGKYQSILAIETSGPREREIVIQIVGC